VRDWLASDPATADFIERIEALKSELPVPSWPATCGPTVPSDAALAGLPDGTYRAIGTYQEALRAGWSECGDQDEQLVLVISSGATAMDFLVACENEPLSLGATFALEHHSGDEYIWRERGYDEAYHWIMTWDEGALTLRSVEPLDCEGCEAPKFLFERTFTMDAPADTLLVTIPDGTYRAVATRADSLRTGWPSECDLDLVDEHHVLILEDGGTTFTLLGACGDGPSWTGDLGTLEYRDGHMYMHSVGVQGEATFDWSFADGTLNLKVVETDEEFAPLAVLQYIFDHEFELTTS